MTYPEPLVTRRRPARSLRGLLVSMATHALLVVAACWVVFRQPAAVAPAASPSFVVGQEGGHGGRAYAVVRKPLVPPIAHRIASKSATASLALPTMRLGGLEAGWPGPSSAASPAGFGRGQGFGRGAGPGVGQAGGGGFVGRPVMGAMIRARRVAVYLDCSGSMRSYLPRVEAEIRRQFPTADVYRFDGARVVGLGDQVVHGRRFQGVAPKLREGPTQTVLTTLTPMGRALQAKVREACEKGSLGAWLDRLILEPYDALVVFSDFQDGIRQYELRQRVPKLVYADSSYHKVGAPPSPAPRWQREWLEAFGRGGKGQGPRLYLFSAQQTTQPFLLACVDASGGSATSVSWLRQGGGGPP